ncbi:uncharacterized protein LOC141600084 [Silene latifolia]|uniref:uncharacterized protein LOC141600084 n=1 Tax=Silene latifolia TaxID=37657 RepID=UPI003D788678
MSYSSSNNNNNRRRMGIRRDKRSREEDFIGFKTGPVLLMPPHWDRQQQQRKPDYDYEYGHDGAFADSGSRYSYQFQPRCSFPSHFRRHSGHGKQAEWHLYQEGSPHEYSTPRSGDRFMDDEYFRPSGPQRNGRYGRNYRDNRDGLGQKEWRGRSWDDNRHYNGPANTSRRPISVKNQRSVANSPVRASHPNSDPSLHSLSKDQADITSDGNGSGVSHRISRENSLGGLHWKPLKCSHTGSLTSRGSFFSHSSALKSIGGKTLKNVTPVQSPSGGDIVACSPSAVPAEDLTSIKKPRIGWGEGLAKYEKKNVEGFEENATTFENIASVGIVEPAHPVTSNLVEMSPEITGFSDCSSPARPSSFTCSSSPGLEEKTYAKTIGDDFNNFSASLIPLSEKQTEGMQFNLEKLELNLIANLSSLLDELLHVDEQFSTDSGLMRSSALSKLLLWKGEISKTLELTETETDSLETELKSLNGNSSQGIPCSDLSKYSPIDDKNVHGDGPNGFARPLPLGVGSSEDIIMESALPSHYARDNHAESKGEHIGSPGTATSEFSELFFAQKAVSPCGWQNSCSSDSEFGKSSGTTLENVHTCDNKRTIEGTHRHVNGEKAIKDASVAAVVENPHVCDKKEDNICDLILASNKETSCIASEMLTKLLPDDNTDNRARGMEACRRSCLTPDITIKKKFWSRKQLLRFKERVISLKYRAFYHLWKEDLCLDSLRNHRLKSHKKLDATSQTLHKGKQKRRSAVRARFGSQAGSLSSDLSTEILNFTRNLLSDTNMKNYRSSLKMPAMVLDEKDKMSSRFMSSNGLVEDPCAVEKERALINPWTFEEKEIFMDKLITHGKDFRKIASFLDHKTIADCIQFYYKNHKSESFEKIKKLGAKKQVKPLYSDTYMLTSEKKWGREVKSASLDILGEASAIAALTDQAMKTLTNKNSRKSDFVTEVATKSPEADLLSSEAMDSCITNSLDPNDGKHELKHRKVIVRRLSTPDISLDVGDDDDDEDICSDEICGERDFGDWTDEEKFLFVRAFSTHGKDFLTISGVVRTKTRDQCKVFFSKGRKCLGLENLISGSCSGRLLGSNATKGSGCDIEDGAGVVKMRYAGCSGKSDSRTERELQHVSQNVSKLDSTENCGPGQLGCNEIDMEAEVLWPADISDIGLSGVFDGSTEVSHVSCAIDPESVSEATNVNSVVSCEILDPDCTSSRNGECKHSRYSGSSNHGDCEVVTDLLVDLTVETESNDDRTHKPGSRKVQSFQERHFRKCSGSASQNDHMGLSRSSDTCRGSGGVKQFENSFSKTSSVGIAGLENVPVRNYGIWDGNKIKVVGYPPSTESSSALLLAKYPPVISGKCNQNNACQFSPREYNDANGSLVDYPIFTLDFKKR